jgi:hypothetical protein
VLRDKGFLDEGVVTDSGRKCRYIVEAQRCTERSGRNCRYYNNEMDEETEMPELTAEIAVNLHGVGL